MSKTMVSTVSGEVSAPPERVWPLVDDVGRLPEWFTFAERAELLGGVGVGRRQRIYGRWGRRRSEVDQRVVEHAPPRRLAWVHDAERLDGKPAPRFAAETRMTIDLVPVASGTRVTLESSQVPAGRPGYPAAVPSGTLAAPAQSLAASLATHAFAAAPSVRSVPGAVTDLANAVAAVVDRGLEERTAIDAMWPAMERFLERAVELPEAARRPDADGGAIGHLLHADPGGRFHILSVVFPPGTSSGTHEHGCWGLIGYVAGLDEETRYRRVDGGADDEGCVLKEVERLVHEPGTISRLLPPDEMHHRVRNPGDVDGVSVHVLCLLPQSHPHKFYDRERRRLLPYPFRVLPGGRVRADVEWET